MSASLRGIRRALGLLTHRKRHATGFRLICIVATCWSMTACGHLPTQEMSDARQALRVAREAQAAEEVPNLFAAAANRLDAATLALESGSYDLARKYANVSWKNAVEARELAVALRDADGAVERAKSSGRPVTAAKAVMRQARTAADDGRGDDSRALITRALDHLR